MNSKLDVSDSNTRLELAVEYLRENPNVSQREIARVYDIPRSTLQARLRGRQPAKSYHQTMQRLSVQEEQALITWIERMTAWGWPPRIIHLEGMAKSLMEAKGDRKALGHHWYKNFLNRHPEFKLKYNRNLDQVRKDASDPVIMKDWFDLYMTTREKYGVADADIYNMDEKGFAMGIADSSKVIIRGNTAPFNVHPGNRDWVTLIECISSRGSILPAYIIFQGAQIQQAWYAAITDEKTTIRVSPNGWTDREIALHWLKEVFHPQTSRTQGVYRLLIVDGHDSHITMEFMEFCDQNKIVPLCLPPHSTHLLQPLDVGVFGPLSKAYKQLVSSRSRYGAVNVSKVEFLNLIQVARKQAMSTTNILSAWRGTGLVPYNPQHVIDKLPRPVTPPSCRDVNNDTPKTTKRIQEASDVLLTRMTPSLRAHVDVLKTTALNAVADRIILQHTNQELIAKQDQRRQKTSRKGHGKAKVLTVGKERELVEEKRQKDEALANKRHDIML